MPSGIYIRTEEHRKSISKSQKGIIDVQIPKYILIEQYENNKKSTRQIGKILNCSSSSILRRLKECGIQTRTSTECLIGRKLPKSQCENMSNIMKSRTGSKSNAWKGGKNILDIGGLIRALEEYANWKLLIFQRDDYTCLDCHKRGVILNAHHKKSFSKILREFLKVYSNFSPVADKEQLVELAKTYSDFWDISNGETLCEDCHEKRHHIFKNLCYSRINKVEV